MFDRRLLKTGKLALIFISLMLLVFTLIPGVVYGDEEDDLSCSMLSGNNLNRGSLQNSFLTASGDQYMRVQYGRNIGIVVSYYDKDFELKERKVIPEELSIFGGFYESPDNYFLVTGEDNTEESDEAEVYRITKYDKSWNRLGSCGLYGANTTSPFAAGSARMAMKDNYLIVQTCHRMYTSPDDNLRHQANVTIEADTDTMTITKSRTNVSNIGTGYVSHSFNQFVEIEDNKAVTVDHGDAYPRAIVLVKYSGDVTSGNFGIMDKSVEVMSFPGEIGNNTTGASVGGFAISDTHYLVAGNAVYKEGFNESYLRNRTKNVFVAAVDKATSEVSTLWLTDQAEGEETTFIPYIVKLADNKYMVLWSLSDGVKYTLIDGSGTQISKTYTLDGELSDCTPILINGEVVWYTWDNGKETFYTISASDPEDTSETEMSFNHDYQVKSYADGLATLKCTKCGDEQTGRVPTSFSAYWRLKSSDDQYYYSYTSLDADLSDTVMYMISGISYSAESDQTFSQFVVESDNTRNCIIDKSTQSVTFKKPGKYKISIYPKYNENYIRTCDITVTSEMIESAKLTASPETPQVYGGSVALTAEAIGGKGDFDYTFTAEDENGKVTTIYTGKESACTWKPAAAGKYDLKVEVKGSANTVTSDTVSYTISKAEWPAVVPASEYNLAQSVSELSNDILNDAEGWEFSASDLGTPLTEGETKEFTASYTADDKDNYVNTTKEVQVTRTSCAHNGKTEVRGAISPTCVSKGSTGDTYCLICGRIVKTASELPVDPDNHEHVSVLPGKAPTEKEEGLTEGKACDDCGVIIVPQTVIPVIKPSPTPSPSPSNDKTKVGDIVKLSNGASVSITSLGEKTVSYDKAGSGKSVTVPDYVTINGTRYTVTVIAGNAFKGSKAKTVTLGKKVKTIKPYAFRSSAVKTLNIKTTKLTKKSVKKSLKKSKVSMLRIKVGTKKKNKKYIKKYKKIFTKANAGKKPKIK